MSNILLFGATGNLGSVFYNSLTALGHAVTPATIDAGLTLEGIIPNGNFDVVLNCAAFTDVVGCEKESNKEIAFALNAQLPYVLAQYCKDTSTRLIHFSTDYVFDGQRHLPYTENSIPNPLNTYGVTKLMGEHYVFQTGCNCAIVRTASLYGKTSGGLNSKISFIDRVINAEEVMYVNDTLFTAPTPIQHVVDCVAENLLVNDRIKGIVHMTSHGATSWYDYARFIAAKYNPSLQVIPDTRRADGVRRPVYPILENGALQYWGYDTFADWTIEFERYYEAAV